MEIALRIWDLDSRGGEMFVDQIIQIAPESARAVTHLPTPRDELEVDCASAEFLEKDGWLRITPESLNVRVLRR